MQSFIQHLLHDVLMKKTLDKVLKLLRKLHWEDEEVSQSLTLASSTLNTKQVYAFILASFTEIWEIKFSNIPYVAALVYDLQRYHGEFSNAIVDQVMEDIRIGMEVRNTHLDNDPHLTATSGEYLQVQPEANFHTEIPRRAVHVSCSQCGSHI